MKKSRRLLTAAGVGVLALGLASAWYLQHTPSLFDPFRKWDREFEPQAWAKTPREERYVFTNDLIKNRRLIGKTRSEVISLLGPSGGNDLQSIDYVVDDGGWDPIVLRIEFDAQGRVAQVLIGGS
jgi:hypothetical protein